MIACLVGCGLLVGAELLFTCFTNMQIVEGKIVKESMILGWGSWTNVGNLLLMTMPSCFYCAVRHRWGFVGYWLGVLHLFFIVLCQSRGALLCGIVPFLACVIYACTQGNNRKKNRAYTVCLLIGLGTVLFGMGELARGLIQNFLDFGFFDNGRFLRWELSWNAFLQNPLFGAGFYSTCNAVGDAFDSPPASVCTHLQIRRNSSSVTMRNWLS